MATTYTPKRVPEMYPVGVPSPPFFSFPNTKNTINRGFWACSTPKILAQKVSVSYTYPPFFGSLPPPHTVCSGKSFEYPVF